VLPENMVRIIFDSTDGTPFDEMKDEPLYIQGDSQRIDFTKLPYSDPVLWELEEVTE